MEFLAAGGNHRLGCRTVASNYAAVGRALHTTTRVFWPAFWCRAVHSPAYLESRKLPSCFHPAGVSPLCTCTRNCRAMPPWQLTATTAPLLVSKSVMHQPAHRAIEAI